jgi:hypothetical protein
MPWLPVRESVGLPTIGDVPLEFGIHEVLAGVGRVVEEVE